MRTGQEYKFRCSWNVIRNTQKEARPIKKQKGIDWYPCFQVQMRHVGEGKGERRSSHLSLDQVSSWLWWTFLVKSMSSTFSTLLHLCLSVGMPHAMDCSPQGRDGPSFFLKVLIFLACWFLQCAFLHFFNIINVIPESPNLHRGCTFPPWLIAPGSWTSLEVFFHSIININTKVINIIQNPSLDDHDDDLQGRSASRPWATRSWWQDETDQVGNSQTQNTTNTNTKFNTVLVIR